MLPELEVGIIADWRVDHLSDFDEAIYRLPWAKDVEFTTNHVELGLIVPEKEPDT